MTKRNWPLKTKLSSIIDKLFLFLNLILGGPWFSSCHCSRKTRTVHLQIRLKFLFRVKSSLKMANIKLKHNLDRIVDHLVSQPVTNTYHSNRKQEPNSQTVKSEIILAVVFQCVRMEKMVNFSKKLLMGTFKIDQSISNIMFYFLNSLFLKRKACSIKTTLKYFFLFSVIWIFSLSKLYLLSNCIYQVSTFSWMI